MSAMGAENFRNTAEAADDALLAALAGRWRLLLQEAAENPGGQAFNPAREAEAGRRLVRAGAGAPPDMIARMWRQFCGEMAAARGLKGYVAGGDVGQTMLGARGYFGFGAHLSPLVEIRDALERASETPGIVAVLPWPEHAGAGQWWPMLNENRFHGMTIVAGWPSLPGSAADPPRVAIVGKLPIEPSGEDEMLATVHDDAREAERLIRKHVVDCEVTARARSLALVRMKSWVAPDDRRLDLARQAGLDGLRIVGVRPRP
jgi:chorismate mutase